MKSTEQIEAKLISLAEDCRDVNIPFIGCIYIDEVAITKHSGTAEMVTQLVMVQAHGIVEGVLEEQGRK